MTRPEAVALVAALSRKEKLVAEAVAAGWTYSQISERMGLHQNSVRHHVVRINRKLGCHRSGIGHILWAAEGMRRPALEGWPIPGPAIRTRKKRRPKEVETYTLEEQPIKIPEGGSQCPTPEPSQLPPSP